MVPTLCLVVCALAGCGPSKSEETKRDSRGSPSPLPASDAAPSVAMEAWDVVYAARERADGSTIVIGKVAAMNEPIQAARFSPGFTTKTPIVNDDIPAVIVGGDPLIAIRDLDVKFEVAVLDDALRGKAIELPWNYQDRDFVWLGGTQLLTAALAQCHDAARKAPRVLVDARSGVTVPMRGGVTHRARSAIARLANGDVFVGGGHNPCEGTPLDTSEVFHPSTKQWSSGPKVPAGDYAGANALGADKVLLFGDHRVVVELAKRKVTPLGEGGGYEAAGQLGNGAVLVASGTETTVFAPPEFRPVPGPRLVYPRGPRGAVVRGETPTKAYVLGGGSRVIEGVDVR